MATIPSPSSLPIDHAIAGSPELSLPQDRRRPAPPSLPRRAFLVASAIAVSSGGSLWRQAVSEAGAQETRDSVNEPASGPAETDRRPGPSNVTAAMRDRMQGLLIGGLLGDALGGPVEFVSQSEVASVMPGARQWPESRRLDEVERQRLAESLPLLSYDKLRPEPAPYAQWPDLAAAGTVTDDSRHKIVLMRTLQRAVQDRRTATPADLARQYLQFTPRAGQIPQGKLRGLSEEGFREYQLAARWLLGDRDESQALPVERLWSGIANCSGQMLLLPLAVAYAGRPIEAYRAAFGLDFIDAPLARDMAAALVAGLARALSPALDASPPGERWSQLLAAMRNTDPWRMSEVPFAGRPLHDWLDRAADFAASARGQPARLYRLLEEQGRPVYWWDAHFTLLVPLAMLHFCEFDPLAAMHLTLDFGHDTDSYAQVLGALVGAVHGAAVFPATMRTIVQQRVLADFGEDVPGGWLETLLAYRALATNGKS